MRTGLITILCVLLCACAGTADSPKPEHVAFYSEAELAQIGDATCDRELQAGAKNEHWWLCGYGWRPAKLPPGSPPAIETYRLVWVRSFHPRMFVRVSLFADGSGAVWATTDVKNGSGDAGAGPRAQAAILKPGELLPLIGRLDAGAFWTASANAAAGAKDKPEANEPCAQLARWILEGERKDGHRAISVQSCGEGQWVIDLGTELLRFAQTKFPGLPVEPIY